MAGQTKERLVTVPMTPGAYHALETLSAEQGQSIPQAAQSLVEEALRERQAAPRDLSGLAMAAMAQAGGGFDWLADEPDLYDDTCGEPMPC